jgi:hypothetical protein
LWEHWQLRKEIRAEWTEELAEARTEWTNVLAAEKIAWRAELATELDKARQEWERELAKEMTEWSDKLTKARNERSYLESRATFDVERTPSRATLMEELTDKTDSEEHGRSDTLDADINAPLAKEQLAESLQGQSGPDDKDSQAQDTEQCSQADISAVERSTRSTAGVAEQNTVRTASTQEVAAEAPVMSSVAGFDEALAFRM